MKLLSRFLDASYIYAFLGEATLGLTFVLYIIMARFLGPEQYGIFAASAALGGILSFLIQFGLPPLLAREVAANPEEGSKSTMLFLLIEGLNSLLILPLLLPVLRLLNFEGIGIPVSFLVFFSEIFRSAKQTLRSVFRGLEQFREETISVSIERTLTILAAGGILLMSRNLLWVVAAIVIVRAVDIIGLVYYLNQKLQIWLPIRFADLRKSVIAAYPFALHGVFWILYYQIDILMLKGISTAEEVGFYSAAYRIIEIFSALPRVIFYVSFTRLVQCYAKTPEKLSAEVGRTLRLLLIGVLPFVVAAGFAQSFLVDFLYGESYLPSIASLSILLASLGIKMFGNLSEYFLQAVRREKALPPLIFSTVVLNVLCNAILIPRIGATGAALATLLSEVALAVMSWFFISRTGHKRIGESVLAIAMLSLLVASVPAFLVKGLILPVGIGVLLADVVAIVLLMQWNFPISVESPVEK